MITALLVGTIIGFVIAMPPGPVGVTSMKLGLRNGLKTAGYMALGSGIIDTFFCMIAIFTASATVSALANFNQRYPIYTVILQIIIIFAFIAFGVRNLKTKKEIEPDADSKINITSKSKKIQELKAKGPFFLGIAISLTNIANPSFLPSLGYLSMQVHQFGIFESMFWNNIFFSIGFGFGNTLWLYVLASIVIRLKDRYSENLLLRVRQFAGITFIFFGGLLGWRVLMYTKWTEVFGMLFTF